jgi:hypothetical protein
MSFMMEREFASKRRDAGVLGGAKHFTKYQQLKMQKPQQLNCE